MQMPPFNAYLGMELQRRESGTAEVTLELAPHHLNRRGVAHGGVVTALLDSALGAAVISAIPEAWWCATTSLSTQFIGGAGEGRLTATGRLTRRGAKLAFAEGEVRDAGNRLIATAHGTWHLWSSFPGKRPEGADGTVTIRATRERVRVGKILAVGRNYAAHAAEMGAEAGGPPILFLKPPSALVGDGARIWLPQGAGEIHHEVELVAVVGRSTRNVSHESALDHVLGYAVGLDLTLRELQSEAKRRGEPWSLSKGFDGAAPISSVVGRDVVGDGSGLKLRLAINGETRQEGDTSRMLRGVAELIAYASRWMTLERGDLLFTGTPAGVGPIRPGDRLVATLEKVGTLNVDIVGDGD